MAELAPGLPCRLALVASLLSASSCASDATSPTPSTPPPSAAPASGQPWVSAYYAGWYWEWYPPSAVDMTTMTHFIFGRYKPGAGATAGQLIEAAGTGNRPEVENALVGKAHASGVRALMMLGGAGDGEGFLASTAPSRRAGFIESLLDKLVEKDYDGIDVDWEDGLESAAERGQLVGFLRDLRPAASLRARYRPPNQPLVVTFPGYAVNVNTDLPVPAWKVEVASLVDQYNLMTYSMNSDAFGWQTWLFSPLKGAGPSHPTSVESSIRAYVDAGVPRSKLGMGIGLFGSYYYPPVNGPRQAHTGGGGSDDNYDNFARFYRTGMLSHPSGAYVWDEAAEAGYYRYSPPAAYRTGSGATVSIGMLTTDDERSIASKGAWARAGNCGGTIVWTINYGYVDATVGNPPMAAVKRAFLAR